MVHALLYLYIYKRQRDGKYYTRLLDFYIRTHKSHGEATQNPDLMKGMGVIWLPLTTPHSYPAYLVMGSHVSPPQRPTPALRPI